MADDAYERGMAVRRAVLGNEHVDAVLRDGDVAAAFDGKALDSLLDPVRYLGDAGAVVDRVVERALADLGASAAAPA